MKLTPAQLAVVQSLAAGLGQKQIAGETDRSVRTIEKLVAQARLANSARTTYQLVAMAVREGLV